MSSAFNKTGCRVTAIRHPPAAVHLFRLSARAWAPLEGLQLTHWVMLQVAASCQGRSLPLPTAMNMTTRTMQAFSLTTISSPLAALPFGNVAFRALPCRQVQSISPWTLSSRKFAHNLIAASLTQSEGNTVASVH